MPAAVIGLLAYMLLVWGLRNLIENVLAFGLLSMSLQDVVLVGLRFSRTRTLSFSAYGVLSIEIAV